MNADTVSKLLLERALKTPDVPAFSFVQNRVWVRKSWLEFKKRVRNISFALISSGVKKGDRVAILSSTRYEIAISDLAISCMGAISVPVFPESTEKDCEYILSNSETSFIFVEDGTQLKKIRNIYKHLKKITGISLFSRDNYVTHFGTFDEFHKNIIHFKDLNALGEKEPSNTDENFETMVYASKPGDVYSIIYTSGVTGQPKGVVTTNFNALVNVSRLVKEYNLDFSDITIPILPFAGGMGRIEFLLALITGWHSYYFRDISNWKNVLGEIKPTLIFCTPYMIEKNYYEMQEIIRSEKPFRQRLIKKAIISGLRVKKDLSSRGLTSLVNRVLYYFVRSLFLINVMRFFGGRLRVIFTGGGYINPEIVEFYSASGISVVNLYGLAETFFLVSRNYPEKFNFSPAGQLLTGIDCKISDDGEILLRGDGVFSQYYNDTDRTENAFVAGWFKTGDTGELESNQLTVLGRKEDRIVTSEKNVISLRMLEVFFSFDRFIGQILICGQDRPYLTAIVTLNRGEIFRYANYKGIYYSDFLSLCENKIIRSLISRRIDALNSKLEPFEAIKKFKILDRDFTIEDGELTPSLKLKRKYCLEKFSKIFDKMYE